MSYDKPTFTATDDDESTEPPQITVDLDLIQDMYNVSSIAASSIVYESDAHEERINKLEERIKYLEKLLMSKHLKGIDDT